MLFRSKYEFTAPEGQAYDAAVLAPFEEVARELNLTQEAAQKVLDKMAPAIAARQEERVAAIQAEWAEQTRADKDLGGEALSENLAVAKTAMNKFASPKLQALLHSTGLGNHPEVIRLFNAVGRAISEDTVDIPGGDPIPSLRDDPRTLYPNSNLN